MCETDSMFLCVVAESGKDSLALKLASSMSVSSTTHPTLTTTLFPTAFPTLLLEANKNPVT